MLWCGVLEVEERMIVRRCEVVVRIGVYRGVKADSIWNGYGRPWK